MKPKDKETLCPNCENTFDNNFDFCPHCGQKNKEVKLGFKYLINDFLAGSFNIDSKFILSFKLLILKPSFLSKEFLKGKRTKYLSPLRMYLLVSLAYFAILSLDNSIIKFDNDVSNTDSITSNMNDVVIFENENPAINDSSRRSKEIYAELNDSTESIAGIEISKFKALNTKEGQKKFKESFSEYVSGSMFFVMPLAAFILFLFYGKRRKGYYFESLIFFIHLQTLLFLILSVFILLELITTIEWIKFVGYLIVLLSSIVWIKNFYAFTWVRSVFATFLFIISYLFIILISFAFIAYFSLLLM